MRRQGFTLALLLATAMACAQAEETPLHSANMLELGTSSSKLSNSYGRWHAANLHLTVERGGAVTHAEVARQTEYGEVGTSFVLGHVREYDDDWIASGFAATSDGGFFLPRLKLDMSLGRKVLADKSLVLSLGLGANRAKDGHHDGSVIAGAVWYAAPRWVVDGGIRWNRSYPGSVDGYRPYLALTWGEHKHQLLTARAEVGNEAYQVIGQNASVSDIRSQSISLKWRQWLAPGYGFAMGIEHYHSPYYRRTGVDASVFTEF